MMWNKIASQVKLNGAPVLHHRCEPAWRWSIRFVDFDLWIVLDGEGWISRNGAKPVRVWRGEGLLFRPLDTVEGTHNPEDPLRVFAAHFTAERGAKKEIEKLVPPRIRYHDVAQCETAALQMAEPGAFGAIQGGLAEIQLCALLARAAADALRTPSDPVENKLRHLCLEISSDPSLAWDARSAAAKSGLSLSQFNRRFKALTGTSFSRYTIRRRIDRAVKLLAETPLSLQNISDALGYSDVYYFNRQFRAEIGITPGRIRRSGPLF